LAEFTNSALSKKYEIKLDPEVLKIATTAIEQKKVRFKFDHVVIDHCFYSYYVINVGFILVTLRFCVA